MVKNSARTGQPGDHRFRSPGSRGAFISGGNSCRNAREHSIGESGLGVGLENHVGNAAHPGGQHHRSGGISANTKCRDGLVLSEYPRSVQHAGRKHGKIFEQRARRLCLSVPPTRSVSSGSPACGTSFISIPRCVPTSTTSLVAPARQPLLRNGHRRENVPAGAAACDQQLHAHVASQSHKTFTHHRYARCSLLSGLLTDIQEHAGGQQHHQQTRSAIADKRQRNSLGRHHPEHHREIDQRLADAPSR